MLITCSFAVIFTVVIWNMRKSVSAKSKRDKTDAKEEKKSNESGTNEENHANNVYHKVDEMKLPKKDTIPELPDPKWRKVGQIQELYMYPLKSGRGKDVTECDFTEYGISIENEGRFILRDR